MEFQFELPGLSRQGYLRECLDYLIKGDLQCKDWTRKMHSDHARYLLEYFGDVEITHIRYDKRGNVKGVKNYYDDELRRGLSKETIRKRLYTLRMAMDSAIRREIMAESQKPKWPVIKTERPVGGNIWTMADWQAAHAECDDDEFRAWTALAWWTGMHSSDLDRCRWQDIDFIGRTWVRRCTKSKIEPAVLKLPAGLYNVLIERYSTIQPRPAELVCGIRMGNCVRVMRELSHRAGVPTVSPIRLRHSCATFLQESGCDEAFITLWLGHKSPVMHKKVYTHATQQQVDRSMEAIDSRH